MGEAADEPDRECARPSVTAKCNTTRKRFVQQESIYAPLRPALRLRLGNPTAGDRLSGDLSLPPPRRTSVSETRAAIGGDLALSMADFSNHARVRFDQAPRRP